MNPARLHKGAAMTTKTKPRTAAGGKNSSVRFSDNRTVIVFAVAMTLASFVLSVVALLEVAK